MMIASISEPLLVALGLSLFVVPSISSGAFTRPSWSQELVNRPCWSGDYGDPVANYDCEMNGGDASTPGAHLIRAWPG
jgi:hypothetical protein